MPAPLIPREEQVLADCKLLESYLTERLADAASGEEADLKAAKQLVQRYQVIVFEDIQTGNLTRKPKPKLDEKGVYLPNGASAKGGLNKSILDAGWGSFVQLCSVKAAWAGRTLMKVDPSFTSQVCSGCGQVRKKDLSERWHSCECGTELDRDVNAAINILERGRRQQSAMAVEAPCL